MGEWKSFVPLNQAFQTATQRRPGMTVVLHHNAWTAAAAATNNGAAAWTPTSQYFGPMVVDLTGYDSMRVFFQILGTAAANKLQIRANSPGESQTGGATSWTDILFTSAGSHTSGYEFNETASIPDSLKISNLAICPGIYGGDGAADPQIMSCRLYFYAS
jgi:hypothetical protein